MYKDLLALWAFLSLLMIPSLAEAKPAPPKVPAPSRPLPRTPPALSNKQAPVSLSTRPSKAPKLVISTLLKSLRAVIKKHNVPGVGLAIVTKDQVLWQGGLGYADLQKKRPATKETLFRVGSISKSFVALGVLRLIRQGRLSLQTPIKEYIPEIQWSNPWAQTDPIRLVHLLEHTAGFDDMHFNEAYNILHAPDLPMKQVLARNPGSRRARWRPGTWVSYSNPGYGVLGYILEKRTGKAFEDFLKEEVLLPLGMQDSSFRKTKQVKTKLAQGYTGKGNKKAIYRFIYHRPAGSLHASPKEMARFVQFLLRRGKTSDGKSYLPPYDIKRMEHPQSSLAVQKGIQEGYGLGNYVSYTKGWKSYGHGGGIDGFLSGVSYHPKHNIGYVLLVNQMGKGFGELNKLLSETMSKAFQPPPPKAIPMKTSDLARWTGTYQILHARNQLFSFMNAFLWIRVSLEKDYLISQKFGLFSWSKKKKLYPVQKGRFRLQQDPEATHYFVKDHERGTLFFYVGTTVATFRRYASFWPSIIAYGFVSSVLLMLSALLFWLFWGWRPRNYMGPQKLPWLRVRLLPLLSVVSLFAAFFCIMGRDPMMLATFSLPSIGFFLFSLCFALFASISLWVNLSALRTPEISFGVRLHSLLVSIACVGFMFFCWPLIGIRFWAGW